MSDNKIKNSIHESINVELNPIVIQLEEFGYDKIYSRRVFYYLHPEDIEEALNYMSSENGIIQHRFVQDKRDISNKMCYICGENEEVHLKDLNYTIKSINDINPEKNEEIKEEEKPKNIDTNSNKINNVFTDIKNDLNLSLEQMNRSIKSSYAPKVQRYNLDSETNLTFNKETQKELDNSIFEIIKPIIKQEKKECEICNEIFIINEFNQLEKCGHSFCESCWYDSLTVKIKENKLASIKCLEYTCEEKLPDYFIENILKQDNNLLKIYQRYKLELEVVKDPNKKFCPYPNCDSYLELINIHNKDVACLNNHSFCFICLKKPHGNLPCNGSDLDKSVVDYAMNNFVKKCPKCNIIIEKNKGCNHITCTKCGYQWCWLCNGKYNEHHYFEGKCKGFQFYQPKNDYDIKLAMEGKINPDELSNSQRQFDDPDFDAELPHPIRRINIEPRLRRENLDEEMYQYANWLDKTFEILIFIFFGFCYAYFIKFQHFSCRFIFFAFFVYLLFSIAFLLQLIFFNLISFVLILIFIGFKRFIVKYNDLRKIFFKKVYCLFFNLIFLAFRISYESCKSKLMNYLHYSIKRIIKILTFFPYLFLTIICFFPYNIFFSIGYMIYSFVKRGNLLHIL